jgi:uncharacterized lipoprotein YmbA
MKTQASQRQWLGACLIALLLSACSSPDPNLYTLAPTTPVTTPPAITAPLALELHRVGIPGTLDRPEIVRSAADYRVHLASNDRWSEPFGDLLQRVLTEDLTRRLPGATVFSATGQLSQAATRVAEVEISRLDADGAGQVVLDAQYVVRGPDDTDTAPSHSVHLTAPTGGDTADYAAAISTVTGDLADAIAYSVR